MKPNPPSRTELDKDAHLEQVFNPDPADEVWVESHLPPGWWKHPVFDFGLHYPCPYIWFAYWLITWEEEVIFDQFNCKWFYWRFPKIHTPSAPCFSVLHISISFMPD